MRALLRSVFPAQSQAPTLLSLAPLPPSSPKEPDPSYAEILEIQTEEKQQLLREDREKSELRDGSSARENEVPGQRWGRGPQERT